MAAAFGGEAQEARISFASVELLLRVLSTNRLDVLEAMRGQGAMGMREVARRLGRDVKGVHGDMHALLDAGLLDRTGRRFVFPYDAVHVHVVLGADQAPKRAA